MTLSVSTDADTLAALARRFLARDPVRGTFLGTIGELLGDGAWAATDGDRRLAIRSGGDFPLLLLGDWPPPACVELVATLPDVIALSGTPDAVRAVQAVLGRPASATTHECLFRCDELRPPARVDGRARRATPDDHDLLVRWMAAFMSEAHAGFGAPDDLVRRAGAGCWLWSDGADEPVSFAVRRAVFGGCARIGPVYTPPPARGRGYGSAVTAAATRDVLDDAAVPVLFTDLANPTSNKIYRELGYRPVEERLLVRLA